MDTLFKLPFDSNKLACYTAISLLVPLVWFCSKNQFRYRVNNLTLHAVHFLAAAFTSLVGLLAVVFQFRIELVSRTYISILANYSKLIGLTIEIRRGNNFSYGDKAAVLVLNHQHALDVAVHSFLLHKFSSACTSISKKKTFPIWPMSTIAQRVCGVILINNDGSVTDNIRDDMNNTIAKANKGKWKIVFYPEGTRNDSDKLLPFKKGAFRTAIEHQLPIVAVVTSPYYFIDRRKKIFNKGHVIMDILSPISTEGLTLADTDRLIKEVHDKMSDKYAELRREVLE